MTRIYQRIPNILRKALVLKASRRSCALLIIVRYRALSAFTADPHGAGISPHMRRDLLSHGAGISPHTARGSPLTRRGDLPLYGAGISSHTARGSPLTASSDIKCSGRQHSCRRSQMCLGLIPQYRCRSLASHDRP